MGKTVPSVDHWLREAKQDESAGLCGMYLVHNGTVRRTARAAVREGVDSAPPVIGMLFGYDGAKVDEAVAQTRQLPGIHYVRVWLNEGELQSGEDIMLVLVGGDIRPHVVDALQFLVGAIKSRCVTETEIH